MSAIRESIESTIKKIELKKRKCRFARCSKVSFDCKFEGNNFIDRYAKIVSSSLGYATYVGHNSSIEGCNVGRYTCIGPNVRIIHGNHPVHEFVSIHPAFFLCRNKLVLHMWKNKNTVKNLMLIQIISIM